MADEKGYKDNNDNTSLNDLLSLAFSKKKENNPENGLDIRFGEEKPTPQDDSPTADSSDASAPLDLSEIFAKAKSKRQEQTSDAPVKAYVRPVGGDDFVGYGAEHDAEDEDYDDYDEDEDYEDYDDGYEDEFDDYVNEDDTADDYDDYDENSEDDGDYGDYEDDYLYETEELSVEQMVAKAMSSQKRNNVRYVERVATEEDAISEEELSELMADTDMYDSFVEHENHGKTKWYKNKKLIAAVSLCCFFIIMSVTILAIFFSYYNKLRDTTVYAPQAGTQAEKHENDTVDADEYDRWLKQQLASIADNAMSDENVTNILIIAEDLRDTSSADFRGNTDVIILASINKTMETLTLTSIMRDIYCDIPGYYADKINSAYAKGGPETLMLTLQSNFGVVVDRYVIVNFETFIKIVEAIGGIEADVTDDEAYAMIAPLAEQNDLMGNPRSQDVLSEGGHYILNGNQALAYSRIRYNVGDDFGRTRRQREVIYTAADSIKELSLTEIKTLVDDILNNDLVKTNLTEGEVASLLLNSLTYLNYTKQELQIPADGTWTSIIVRGMDCLSPNFVKNAQLIQETVYGSTNIDSDAQDGEYTNTLGTTSATLPQTYPTYQTEPPVATTPVETTPPVTTTTEIPQTTPLETTTPAQTTTETVQTTPLETTTSEQITTVPETTTAAPETTPAPVTTPPPETTPTPGEVSQAADDN